MTREEILEKIKKKERERAQIHGTNRNNDEGAIQILSNEIGLLKAELKFLSEKNGENKKYCTAEILMACGDEDPRRMRVIIMDRSDIDSLESPLKDKIISKETFLARAIKKGKVGNTVIYPAQKKENGLCNGKEVSIRIISKKIHDKAF